jgi:hypothetical protein
MIRPLECGWWSFPKFVSVMAFNACKFFSGVRVGKIIINGCIGFIVRKA